VRNAFEQEGTFPLELEGEGTVDVGPGDVEVRATSHAEFALSQEGGYAVALDTTLDDDLRREGLARELARRLNDLRKASGFEIADRVRVRVWGDRPVAEAARHHEKWISEEVLAADWDVLDGDAPDGEGVVRLDVEGCAAAVQLERIARAS
jgi:isoleucyl-tRNA synthetase